MQSPDSHGVAKIQSITAAPLIATIVPPNPSHCTPTVPLNPQ